MPSTPNTIRVVVSATHEGSIRQSVLHFRGTTVDPWTQAELQVFATGFWNQVRNAWKACCGSQINFVSVIATDVSTPIAQQGVYTIPQPEPGTALGEALPAHTACVISWKSLFTHRSFRGRTYIYGQVEGDNTTSTLLSPYLTRLATLAASIAGYQGGGGRVALLAIRSIQLNISTPVTGLVIDQFIDSQRRRLIGRGQ